MSSRVAARLSWGATSIKWARLVGLALLGWGAWLSFPGTTTEADREPGLTALVLDVSASATRRRTGWEVSARRCVQEIATEAAARGDDLLLVTYAADVRRIFGPAPAEEALAELRGLGASPGQGLRFAQPAERALESRLSPALDAVKDALLAPLRAPSRLLLRTDGTYTGADPASTLSSLVARGIRIETRELEAPDQPDLALSRFEVARRLELGARATARFELVAQGFDAARHTVQLELEIEFGGAILERTVEAIKLPNGASKTFHFVDLGLVREGATSVSARVVLKHLKTGFEGDRVPENDRAQAEFQSRDALICLVVSHDSQRARDWVGEDPPGMEVRYLAPDELAEQLVRADLCVSVDISLGDLDGVLLRSFLQRGGGWLAAGGWQLLRDWESDHVRAAAELLPLEPAEDDRPPRDVQFIVDGSGSMRGGPFEAVRAALIDLVPAAPLQDRVSLRFFTGALQPPIVLSVGESSRGQSREERVRELLSDTVPGGQTMLVSSLEQLSKERVESAEEALILLLSDGRESNGFNSVERGTLLAAEFVASRTQFEVIAVGEDPDFDLLRSFLPEGREPTRVFDYGGLEEVFQRSVNRERVESGSLPLLVSSVPEDGPGSGLSQALRRTTLPPIARALLTKERAGAAVLLRTGSGNPVLAIRRVGTGLCAMLATGPGREWNGGLKLGVHLGDLLRTLGREAHPERAPRFVLGEELVLENARLEWPAQLEAHFVRTDGREEVVLGQCLLGLSKSPPATDPRNRRVAARPAVLDGLPRGAALAVDLLNRVGERLARLSLDTPAPIEFSLAHELRLPRDRLEFQTSSDLAIDEVGRELGAAHPSAPYLLLAGLLLSAFSSLAGSRRPL